jgi:hypothetical protein
LRDTSLVTKSKLPITPAFAEALDSPTSDSDKGFWPESLDLPIKVITPTQY